VPNSKSINPAFRREGGAAAVEFALILTLLILLVFGIIQLGLAYNRYQGLQAAAREGARVASIGGSQTDIRDRVRQSQSLFASSDVLVRIDYSTDNGSSFPGPAICSDSSGSNQCNSPGAPHPCGVAGIGNLIRVTAEVPSSKTQYAIVIPLWGSAATTYSARGVFRCERT
jgi:Flp pilus assembly protein TadG